MSPSLFTFNAANSIFSNSVFSRDNFLQSIILSYCKNLIFFEFRCCAAFTSIASSMFGAIGLIASGCIPTKIIKMVIPKIAIIMATFLSWLRWPNKCKKNKAMNSHNFLFVVFPKIKEKTTFGRTQFFIFRTSIFSAISKIRDFIKVLVTNNWKPNFMHFYSSYTHNRGYGIIA